MGPGSGCVLAARQRLYMQQARVLRVKDRQRAQICRQAEAVEQAQLRRAKAREGMPIIRQAQTV